MNATPTAFEIKDTDFTVFESDILGVRECFPLLSGPPTLELNIFQIRSIIILYQIHFHFYISFLNPPGIRER